LEPGSVGRLESFHADNPDSEFKFTMLMELADAQWRHGWFMKALQTWKAAWDIGKTRQDPQEATLGQLALNRLLDAYAKLGHKEELRALLAEAKELDLSAGAMETYRQAESILWFLDNQPEQNIFCGFTALNSICVPRGMRPAFPDVHDEAEKKVFIEKGLSVAELVAHSHESGGKSIAVKRNDKAPIPVPSVIHWNFNHYSAITKEDKGKYYIEDLNIKFSGWVEKAVIEQQSSGVFILPDSTIPHGGCVLLKEKEMKSYFGRHCVHGRDDEGCNKKTDCAGAGMATHSLTLLNPGLAIGDIPIGLDAPYGPSLEFRIEYFQRRNGTLAVVPTNIGNMGSLWTHNYAEWIELKGTGTPNTSVNLVTGDGTYFSYQTPVLSNGVYIYASRYEDRPTLEWSASQFTLRYIDGSLRRYSLASGTTRYLLTQIVDNQGSAATLTYDASMRLIKVTDATGRFLQIGYTPVAGDGVSTDTLKIRTVTDSHGRVASFRYDASGRLIKSIDTINITSEFTYGAAGFIERLTTPYGVTRFEFEDLPGINTEPGRRIKAIDPYGYPEVVEANDLTPAPEFDQDMKTLQNNNVTASVNVPVAGQNVSFMPKNENLQWRNTWHWDKNAWYHAPGDYSQATVYNWLAVNNSIVGIMGSMKKAHEGRVWFNYKGQPSSHAPGTHNSPSKILRLVETPAGNQWAMQQIAYDGPDGSATRSIDPLGREMAYAYTGKDLNTVAVRTGPTANDFTTLGTVSAYVNRLPTAISDVSGLNQSLTYNSVGQVTEVIVSKGANTETTRFTYDQADGTKTKGFLLNVQHTSPINPSAFVTLQTFTYDSFKRVRTSTDEQGYTLTYDYDAMDRVRLVTYPDATTEQYEYENLDLTAAKNRLSEWSRTKYTALRQPAYTIDPEGRFTSFEYCLCGQIKKLTDPRGNVTRWTRDNQGRVTEKISPDLTKTTFTYQSRSGRLGTITRPNDQATGHVTATFSYTLDGMSAAVDYYDPNTPDNTFNYNTAGVPDPLGRLISRTDPIGTTAYSYHPLTAGNGAGQLYEENGPLADDTIRRNYDWQGGQISRQVRSDAGTVLHSESVVTDSLGRLTQSTNELGTFTASYTAGNISANMNSWTRPNGMVTQFDWYAANGGANALGLKEIHHIGAGATAGTTVSKFGYSYDLAGRIKGWSRQLDPAPANKKDWTMAYSRAGQLTGVVEKDASSVETSRKSWSYDPAGNWYATGDSTATTHRTHDSMNRLNQIGGSGKTVVEGTLNEAANVSVSGQPAQVASVPGTTDYNFRKEIPVTEGNNNFQITATDSRGNARTQNYTVQVAPAQKTYEYDSNGNLLREKDPQGAVIRSFEWDGADRLKAITSGSQRIEWTYNGLGQRVLETVNGVASKRFLWDGIELLLEKTATHTITKKFYGDGEQRVGGTDAGNYFYTRDHLGSVREVVKQDGTLQARYDYDAYGKRTAIFQDVAYLGGCDFGYTGHITLPALATGQSELLLTLYRAYDPQLGRWLSPDPGGEWDGLNLYGYVGGDSINSIDPTGLWKMNWKRFGWGFVKGFAVGVVIGAAIALASPVVAVVATVALVTLAVVSAVQIKKNWGCMSDGDKSELAGNVIGGVVGGSTGARSVSAYRSGYAQGMRARPGSYRPNLPLPRDRHGNPLPDPNANGAHTQIGTKKGSKGDYTQAREFDNNGQAVKDIDFTDHGRPNIHTNPHQHPYIPNPTGGSAQRGAGEACSF
jgi:RHS repeat-associated protein